VDEGLFFWLIIIAVVVLQGIGRKKRKAGQPGQEPPGSPGPRTAPPGDQEGVTASTASSRPTVASPRPTMDSPRPGQEVAEEASSEESSEGMVPADVWAEILGLARGETQRAEPEAPPPAEAAPVPWAREERPREDRPAAAVALREGPPPPVVRSFPTSHGADAVLHQTKTGDFESRLAVSRTPTPELEPGGGRGVRAGLFGSGSPRELRKAIILKEVLGPPLSLREE